MLSSLLSDPSGSPFFLYSGLDSLRLSERGSRRLPAPLYPRLATSFSGGSPRVEGPAPGRLRVPPLRQPTSAFPGVYGATSLKIVSRPPSRHYQGFVSVFKWWF